MHRPRRLTSWWSSSRSGSARGSPVAPGGAAGDGTADRLGDGRGRRGAARFEVGGRLVEVAVEEGQMVWAGDEVAGPDDELIQVPLLQADVPQRRQLEVQAQRYIVRAPRAGTVTRVPVHVGEVVAPVQVLAAVADLSRLKLTLYVPEAELGAVQIGQVVELRADPFPTRTFTGVVTSINSQAEFTPRNVQTRRDRETLVFGVKVRVDNPDQALKPGLPVDAVFRTPGAQ